jgi:hypothetical protein
MAHWRFWLGLYISSILVVGVYTMDVILDRTAKRSLKPRLYDNSLIKDPTRYQTYANCGCLDVSGNRHPRCSCHSDTNRRRPH